MDFFQYASIADIFMEFFLGVPVSLWVSMVIGGVCFLTVYVFQTIGLFTIAKHEGYKNKWMAFVPFFNTYYIGRCGAKNRFFRVDTKKIAIATAVIEFVALGVYILSYVANHLVEPYLVEHTVETWFGSSTQLDLPTGFNSMYPNLIWAGLCYKYLDFLLAPLNIVQMLGMIVILNCFFQTYAARRYFLFTLTSVLFPVQGILIFAVRNNKGMSYADYVRSVQERIYRQYREQQNFNQNPYNQNPYSSDYNRPPYQDPPEPQQPPQSDSDKSSKPEDPFAEFGSSKKDGPFDEFN